ncbi:hypothetical protein ASF54_13230 [Frondihabitans sp. Leaf304]|nr:hypothetical protein ASF54_13230 [Frondihabitans sp. Leaf304]
MGVVLRRDIVVPTVVSRSFIADTEVFERVEDSRKDIQAFLSASLAFQDIRRRDLHGASVIGYAPVLVSRLEYVPTLIGHVRQ